MQAYLTIVMTAAILGVGLLGIGIAIDRRTCPAVAGLYGWTLVILLGATAWFFKFPAVYLAPAVIALLAIGWWQAWQRLPRAELLMAAVSSTSIATLFAYPFLRYPHLQAYACWGTDQWGYISVAKWLVHHSVDALPVLDNKPGRDWIWYVLTVKDRPLIYTVMAMISGASRVDASLVYYVLPAALSAAVAHGLVLYQLPAGIWARAGRLLAGLCLALQPVLLLHLQYQYLGGVVAGLLFMLLTLALFQARTAEQDADLRLYAVAVLMAVLLAGLYTVKITLVALVLVAVVGVVRIAVLWLGKGQIRDRLPPKLVLIGALTVLVVAGLGFYRTRMLVPEPWSAPPVQGKFGHAWMHWGAIFGETDILPWYVPDDTPGTDPVAHHPVGGLIGVWLLGGFALLYGVQCWRWFRSYRDLLPVVVLLMLVMVGYYAMPPQGSHWNVSRTLPVFGSVFITAVAATAFIRNDRWMRWLVMTACCIPLVRATPQLWRHFADPACRMIEGEWKHPPDPFVWGALGYAYFYEDKETIDWTTAPESFRAMTHYVPEELRPKMPAKKTQSENSPAPKP